MSSKDMILKRIRETSKAEKVVTRAVDIKKFIRNDGDLYENFKTNLTNNKTIIHECKKSEIDAKVEELLEQFKTKRLMIGSKLPITIKKINCDILKFNKSINEIYNEAFDCDTSIIEAALGVSNFGLFCVKSSKHQPRLLSLLPSNCIVLLKKDQIVESLYDALEEVTKDELPTNIIFIIGPSRTSDIELQLVLGVHGPQNVHVILYE